MCYELRESVKPWQALGKVLWGEVVRLVRGLESGAGSPG